jgi:hypothetical protein
MLKRTLNLTICLVLALFFIFSHPLRAENAGIRDLLVTNNASHLLVYARVTNCFTRDMEAAILAGVPTTFTFFVELYQERRRWFDRKLDSITIRHTIKYDNVKKIFYVSANGDREAASFQDFESAKRAMADLNGIPVAPLKAIKRNEYYYILLKAKLDKVRLPLNMEVIFFFLSLWDFETAWAREGFFY